jgi:hypothetical protein
VGGAIVTASRRKFRMLVPNLRRASSAASSAFCISFRRLAASAFRRSMTDSDSWRVGSVDVEAGWVSEGVASPSLVVVELSKVVRVGLVMEMPRVRLRIVD